MRNQCDGCNQGLPVEDGIHYRPGPTGQHDQTYMVCTRDRYATPKKRCPDFEPLDKKS